MRISSSGEGSSIHIRKDCRRQGRKRLAQKLNFCRGRERSSCWHDCHTGSWPCNSILLPGRRCAEVIIPQPICFVVLMITDDIDINMRRCYQDFCSRRLDSVSVPPCGDQQSPVVWSLCFCSPQRYLYGPLPWRGCRGNRLELGQDLSSPPKPPSWRCSLSSSQHFRTSWSYCSCGVNEEAGLCVLSGEWVRKDNI